MRIKHIAVLFGAVLFGGFAGADELGPWKLGMSLEEIQAVSEYGPYIVRDDGFVGTEGPKFDLLGTKLTVMMKVVDDRLVTIQAILITTDSAKVAADWVVKAADFIHENHNMAPPPGVFLEELPARLESIVGEKNAPYVLRARGHPNPSVFVRPSRDGGFYCYLYVGAVSNRTSTPSSNPPSDRAGPVSRTGRTFSASQVEKPGDDSVAFKRSVSTINALLVRPLNSGGHAAQAMRLSATAVKDRTDGRIGFGFNQAVGNDMRTALNEVVRAMQVKHGALPANMEVTIGFADKWGGKDGPSAAVATALLIESLLGGFEIPTNVAVTGDLNANQNVQPVGGVPDKIRGAMKEKCTFIGVPAANEGDLNDMVVEENLRRFLTAKIFTMKKLDQALELVDEDARSEPFRKSLAEFDAIQKELGSGGAKALYSPAMQTRLAAVHETIPNLYSAKILLAASRRTVPTRYSLAGSLVRIDEAMAPFGVALRQLRAGQSIDKFKLGRNNPLTEAQNSLRALRSKSDKRLVNVINAQATMLDRLQRLINTDAGSRTVFERLLTDFRTADERANNEWKKIIENQQIQDQLMNRGINFDPGE